VTDLDERIRRLIDATVPVSLTEIKNRPSARIRHLQHRHLARPVLVIAACLAVIAGGIAVAVTRHDGTSTVLSVGRPNVTRQTNERPAASKQAQSKGAATLPVDFYDARLWLPAGWMSTSLGACGSTGCTTQLVVGGPHRTSVTLALLTERRAEGHPVAYGSDSPQVRWNGLTVIEVANTPATSSGLAAWEYAVPALNLDIRVQGAPALPVARTLTTSSFEAITHFTKQVPVPSTFRTVNYGPLTLKVPPSWRPVALTIPAQGDVGNHCDQLLLSTVKTGPFYGALDGCARPNPIGNISVPRDGLWLLTTHNIVPSNDMSVNIGKAPVTRTFGNITITLSTAPQSGDPALFFTAQTGKTTVAAELFLGRNARTEEQVLSSITPSAGR
jgi:hypothetical protein